ncbi:MAG: putative metal-binding motif-containing protein [Alphaproteobacteria bacterium]|nr:putative metal-binding motif-containing protein [Alphaproteobacteria bacterium]
MPLLALALAGCLGQTPGDDKSTVDSQPTPTESKPPEETCTFYGDADGDGHGDAATPVEGPCGDEAPEGAAGDDQDCDDADPAVHPGADELCDGVDNNCDGVTDDDAVDRTVWYEDTDSDGYGAVDSDVLACVAPSGYVAAGGDCDDRLAVVNPGEVELCDGRDTDCDPETLEDEVAADRFTFYLDADNDGYGDPNSVEERCAAPTDGQTWTMTAGDCNDTDNRVNPTQQGYFTSADNRDSYDYDCDGTEEQEYPLAGACRYTTNGCSVTVGFEDNALACGERGDRVWTCDTSCQPVTSMNVYQKCR